MKHRYLTFDCYGTLVDWRTGIERELLAAVGEVRVTGQDLLNAYVAAERVEESTYRKYREVLSRAATALSGKFGVAVTREAAEAFADSVPRWPVFPDSAHFLREVGKRGYKRYILSNVDNDILSETIRDNGLEIDGLVTAEDVRSYKPGVAHWMEFMKKTGAVKRDILHVAQSVYHDIIPAQRLGIPTAWVNRYGEKPPSDAEPTYICDSLNSLGEVLE